MTDGYSGRHGPYKSLEIKQSNGLQIGIEQNMNFDNCFAKDVVSAFILIFFKLENTISMLEPIEIML